MQITRKVNSVLAKTLGINIRRAQQPPVTKKPQPSLKEFKLNPYLKDLDKAFTESLAAPSFIQNTANPPLLHIAVNDSTRAVRIELPTKEYLHLHSIVLIGSNGESISPHDIRIITSSAHTEDTLTESQRREALFNLGGNHRFGFYTEGKTEPWITLILPGKTYLGEIIMRNVSGKNALRASGLLVSISDNLKDWRNIYNLGGVKNYYELSEGVAKKYKLFEYDHGKDLFNFTRLLTRGYDADLKKKFSKLPDSVKPAVREAVNKIVLRKYSTEFTSHGIRHSFRFYSADEKKEYIKKTLKVIKDLHELSPDVCLGFGSVLAAVRDKNLLPHDDDMDIIIGFKSSQAASIKEGVSLLHSFLIGKGYRLRKKGFNHCFIVQEGLKIDVFVGIYDKDGTIGWFPGSRGVLHREDIFPARNIRLLDTRCPIPRESGLYLESVYGKDWQTPMPGYQHKWADKSQYQDLID